MAKQSLLAQLQALKGQKVILTLKKNNLSLSCRLDDIIMGYVSKKWVLIIDNGMSQVIPVNQVKSVREGVPPPDPRWVR